MEYYLSLAEQMVAHGTHTIAVKDMAGGLTDWGGHRGGRVGWLAD